MKKIIELGKCIVRNILKLIPAGRTYYARRKKNQEQEVLRNLQENGPEVLRKVHEAFKRDGLAYYVCDGTLLGVIREGGILKHDIDVDFAIMPHSVSPCKVLKLVEMLGFNFFWAWAYDGKIGNIAFTYKQVHVDFDFLRETEGGWLQLLFTKLDGMRYHGDDHEWSVVALPVLPIVTEVEERTLGNGNVVVYVPKNWNEYLSAQYGEWRVPDKKWRENNVMKIGSRRCLLKKPGVRLSREQVLEMSGV